MNFIINFSNLCAPIVETIGKKHQPFKWTKATERGFSLLKHKITKNPILTLPYFQNLFKVKCDASGMLIGVVLS